MWKSLSGTHFQSKNLLKEADDHDKIEPLCASKVILPLRRKNNSLIWKWKLHDSGDRYWKPAVVGGLMQPVLVEVVAHGLGTLLSPRSDWSTHSHCGRVETSMTIKLFFPFSFGDSLAEKFSFTIFLRAHYCGFAGFVFAYIIFPHASLHCHSSFSQIMWTLNTVCFINLWQNGWKYLPHHGV